MAQYDIIGKFVGITADNTVGYGTANGRVLGKVTGIEDAGNTDVYELAFDGQQNSATFMLDNTTVQAIGLASGTKMVVTVRWGEIMTVGVAATTGLTAGDNLTLKSDGSLQKMATGGATNVSILGVNATDKTLAIKVD